MEDVAADEPEDAFEIKRAQHLPGDDAVLEARAKRSTVAIIRSATSSR